MREFKNDYHALQVLRARGIEERKNGILVGYWQSLDPDAKDAVTYLTAEWDFEWQEKEPPP